MSTLESDEIHSLRQQLLRLKELFKAAQSSKGESESDDRFKVRLDQLNQALAERENKIADLQRAQFVLESINERTKEVLRQEMEAKQKALEELSSLYEQFELLKDAYGDMQLQLQENLKAKQEWDAERQTWSQQLESASRMLNEKDQIQQDLERLKSNYDELSHRFEKTIGEVKEGEVLLKSKEEKILYLEQCVQETEKKLQYANDEKILAQNAKEESEARLKIAHYHLAKKVKEVSDLNDMIAQCENEIKEFNITLNESKRQFVELQNQYFEREQQEMRMHQQWQESLHSAETAAFQAQEKLVRLNEKLQENEDRLETLKTIEEKYRQLHRLWSSINSVFESSKTVSGPTTCEPPKQEDFGSCQKTDVGNAETYEERCLVKKPYQNLFDMPRLSKFPNQNSG